MCINTLAPSGEESGDEESDSRSGSGSTDSGSTSLDYKDELRDASEGLEDGMLADPTAPQCEFCGETPQILKPCSSCPAFHCCGDEECPDCTLLDPADPAHKWNEWDETGLV